MKRWLKLGITFSLAIIAFRFILRYILFKTIMSPIQEELSGGNLTGLIPIIQFPGDILITVISSIIIGFLIAIFVSSISKKRRKNENTKSIR